MAWLDVPPEPLELLAFGYVREHRTKLNLRQIVSDDVKHLIYSFYPKPCVLFGIGANNYDELGIEGKVLKFQELKAFSKVSIQPQDIFCGYSRFTVKTHEDRIYSIGNNYNGGCGCGEADDDELMLKELREIRMDLIKREENRHFVQCCSSGSTHVLFVLNDRIYATGTKSHGQCGNYTTNTLYIPTLIDDKVYMGKDSIVQIECGYDHTILLNANGRMFACGSNDIYQCGIDKSTKFFSTIQQIECGVLFKSISVGGHHNLCISTDDKLYIFGKNQGHELGVYGVDSQIVYDIPTIHSYFEEKEIVFISTKHQHSMVLDIDGICYLFGANHSFQISKQGHNKLSEISVFQREYPEFKGYRIKGGSCGLDHTLLITERDNKVLGIGGNTYKQTSPFDQMFTKNPHIFTHMEIGIEFEDRIVRAIAGEFTTVLVQGVIQKRL